MFAIRVKLCQSKRTMDLQVLKKQASNKRSGKNESISEQAMDLHFF
jgi:hypothetical protein